MNIKCFVLAAVASSFALAACGGGSGTAPGTSQRQTAQATFSIVIPSQSGASSHRRTPQDVPADTQSIEIVITAVNGSPPPQGIQTTFTATLNKSNPDCTQSSGGLSCMIPVQVPIGSVTFAVTLYSTTNETGSPIASATTTSNIVAGQANIVTITPILTNGSIVLSLSNPSPMAGSAASITISVSEEDTGGATIVGQYANPITLTDSDKSGATAILVNGTAGSTVANSTDTVTLSYGGLAIVPATISATATNLSSASASFAPTIPAVVLSPTSLSFIGTSNPQYGDVGPSTVTASQAGWTGSYGRQITVTDGTPACNLAATGTSQIVSINTTAGTSFNITPQNVGGCSLTFTGGGGASTQLPISVTTTSIVVQ